MPDVNALTLPDLLTALSADGRVRRLLELARDEDLGGGSDITTDSIIDSDRTAAASLQARDPGVVAGLDVIAMVIDVFDAHAVEVVIHVRDGSRCGMGARLATLRGPLRDILRIERTLLNIVGRLSGVATLTREYVDAVRGEHAVICDTRKTTPGLRNLEKYAVRGGGGTLHRMGLFDAVLFKDNHLAHIPIDELTGAVNAASQRARAAGRIRFVEVEVDTLEQFDRILACDESAVDMVLLDNMTLENLREAVRRRDERRPRMVLEASGGITLQNVRSVAQTGVDRISVGAITHHAMSLDVGLDIET